MVMINWKTGFVSSNSVYNNARNSQQIGLPLPGRPSLLISLRLQTVLDTTQSYYHYKLYRYKIKPCSKTKRMTYLNPDTFMNNIKSCKFLKINDYHKSLPILPVPVRYKGGRGGGGGGETVDQLREVWDVEPD